MWLAVEPGPSESVSEDRGVRTFAAPSCEPVLSAGGRPDVLIVSDLPLQGDYRLRATQMARAIAFVLRERGSARAVSRRRLSTTRSPAPASSKIEVRSERTCLRAQHGRRRRDRNLQLGLRCDSPSELNRAVRGPLGMVSPLNSLVVLTRPAPGTDPALPAALYPTGRRNFVRSSGDDLRGAALAVFAKERGHRRVFVLDDGDPWWGAMMARGFETAATRLGLNVVGAARWNPEAQATRRWPSVWRAPARQPSSWEACWTRTERASSVTCARVWAAPRPFSFLTHSRRCRCSSNRREVPPSAPTRATAVSSPTDCLRPANGSSSGSRRPRPVSRSSRRPSMPRRRPRCCSTRSRARTGRARP